MPDEKKAPARCWLFSEDCPQGQIFTGQDAIDAALEDGWADTPPANAAEIQAADEAEGRAEAVEALQTRIDELLEENKALADQVATQEKDLEAQDQELAELREALAAANKGGKDPKPATAKGKGKGAGK